mmetsp:Transcript_100504/g.299887  ORF Transcript_100504/g.299887 Transcript_100504/m.299887 type:complete len:263 (+) Transcript_100504:353-1141(+)
MGYPDLTDVLLLLHRLQALHGAARCLLAQRSVGDLPVVPDERGGLLLDEAPRRGLDKLGHLGTDNFLPVVVILVQPVGVLPENPPWCARPPELEAVLRNEREAVQVAKVGLQESRVTAADDVGREVWPLVNCTQQLVYLLSGGRKLRPGLKLPQRAVVVQEQGPRALTRRPELLQHGISQCWQRPRREVRLGFVADSSLLRGRGQLNAALNIVFVRGRGLGGGVLAALNWSPRAAGGDRAAGRTHHGAGRCGRRIGVAVVPA